MLRQGQKAKSILYEDASIAKTIVKTGCIRYWGNSVI
jgi:hypothetical protein